MRKLKTYFNGKNITFEKCDLQAEQSSQTDPWVLDKIAAAGLVEIGKNLILVD